MRISQITIVGAVLIFSSLFVVKTVAQPRTGGTGGSVKTSTPPSGGSTPTRKTKATVQIVYRTVEKLVTATTGSLSVGAEANATLLVELLNSKKPRAQQGQVPSDEKIFIFNNLPPGRYRVAGTLEGYHPVEKEVVVVANKSQSASLDFKPVLYSLIVRTNISNGELKYAPQGRPLTYVTPIQNGRAQVELKTGKYDFQITAAEFGYETLRDTVDLGANKELNVPLKRIVNTTDTPAR